MAIKNLEDVPLKSSCFADLIEVEKPHFNSLELSVLEVLEWDSGVSTKELNSYLDELQKYARGAHLNLSKIALEFTFFIKTLSGSTGSAIAASSH